MPLYGSCQKNQQRPLPEYIFTYNVECQLGKELGLQSASDTCL